MPYHLRKWTAEEDAVCKQMIEQGASGRIIAERLGRSRGGTLRHINAVLKMSTKNLPGGQHGPRPVKRVDRLGRRVVVSRMEALFPAQPVEGGVAFADLGSGQCRFEISGARVHVSNMRFCGAETATPGPYCEGHRALCYVAMDKNYKAKPFRLQAIG